MARKNRTVIVPKFPACDNRDEGKHFFIEEWPAARADTWAQRVVYTFTRNGGALPTDIAGLGLEGVAIAGINTFLRGNVDPDVMIPLCDELLECVKVIRDTRHPDVVTPIVSADDIEEVATRWWLRDQVVSVHTNFSPLAALSALVSSIMGSAPTTS